MKKSTMMDIEKLFILLIDTKEVVSFAIKEFRLKRLSGSGMTYEFCIDYTLGLKKDFHEYGITNFLHWVLK